MRIIGLLIAVILLNSCGNSSDSSAGGTASGINLNVTNQMAQDFSSAYIYTDSSKQSIYNGTFKCAQNNTCLLNVPPIASTESFYILFYNADSDLVGAWHSGGSLQQLSGGKVLARPYSFGMYLVDSYIVTNGLSYGATISKAIQALSTTGTVDPVFISMANSAHNVTAPSGSQDTRAIHAAVALTMTPFASVYASNSTSAYPGLNPYSGANCDSRPKENWMGCFQNKLATKRLSDIAIPGTHDSGTAGMESGSSNAKTQTRSIGDQLNDGIRFFDLRVRERLHYGCADSGAWEIYHGSSLYTSYRLPTVLAEIKTYLQQPGHQREIIILDFQSLDFQNDYHPDSYGALLSTIQDSLGPWMIPAAGSQNEWMGTPSKTLGDMWVANDASGGSAKQVIVLLPFGTTGTTDQICGAFDPQKFMVRGAIGVVGAGAISTDIYGGRQTADSILHDIEAQLFPNQHVAPEEAAHFTYYKNGQDAGMLNVLQIVSLPSDAWYAGVGSFCDQAHTILDYADQCINPSFVQNAPGDWLLGEIIRQSRGNHARDPASGNLPNVILIDNYSSGNINWPLGTFVDTVIGDQTWNNQW